MDRKAPRRAHHQANTCAGIAEIHDIRGAGEAACAASADPVLPGPLTRDARPKGPDGVDRAQDIFALQRILYACLALGQSPQNEGAVGDGFIARGPDAATQGRRHSRLHAHRKFL